MKNKKKGQTLLPPLTAEECIVQFDDNTQGQYLAGDLISGKIIFLSQKTQKLNGIKLDIFGKARCGWKHKFGRNVPIFKLENKEGKKIKSAQQEIFQWTTFLMQAEDGSDVKVIANTAITFNFAYVLLKDCPASFEGKFGYVRYFVKVTIIHANEVQQSRLVKFTVQTLLDLNKEHKLLKTPITKESFETMCYIPPDNLALKVTLPKSAFVVGEIIPITVNCRNGTSLNCNHITITLELCAKYATNNSDSLREKIVVTKLSCGPVLEKESKSFMEAIRVPVTPITSVNTCSIVQISYWIRVRTSMQYFLRNATVKVPITIGNVPFEEESVSAISNSAEIAVPPQTPTPSTASRTEFREIVSTSDFHEGRAPPSYEESLSMSRSLEPNTSQSTEFSEPLAFGPQRPYYAAQNQMLPGAPNLPIKYKKRQRVRRRQNNIEESVSSDSAI